MPSKITNARILYDKLFPNPIAKFRKTHKVSLTDALINFQNELISLNNEFNRKIYTDEYIISLLYTNRTFNSKSYPLFCRINLLVCTTSFIHLVNSRIKVKGAISQSRIKEHKEIIKDYIFDLIPFVTFLKKNRDSEYVFFNGGKNNEISTFELFGYAYHLKYSSTIKENFLDQKVSNNLSLFTLRQAMELRFRKAVGVGEIYDKDFESPKLRHDFFPDFIMQNSDLIKMPYKNLKFLIHVYKWTNYYIHYGLSPRVWDIGFALEYSADLFKPTEFVTKSNKSIWNINGSIILEDVEELKNRFDLYMKQNIKSGKIYAIVFEKPEAIINE